MIRMQCGCLVENEKYMLIQYLVKFVFVCSYMYVYVRGSWCFMRFMKLGDNIGIRYQVFIEVFFQVKRFIILYIEMIDGII